MPEYKPLFVTTLNEADTLIVYISVQRHLNLAWLMTSTKIVP